MAALFDSVRISSRRPDPRELTIRSRGRNFEKAFDQETGQAGLELTLDHHGRSGAGPGQPDVVIISVAAILQAPGPGQRLPIGSAEVSQLTVAPSASNSTLESGPSN